MQLLNYQIPDNPLRLLDDYLSSIGPAKNDMKRTEVDNNMDISDSEHQDTAATTNPSSLATNNDNTKEAEQLHNSVLRVAAELFGNNISLLENSLALLEEQEQYQNNDNNNNTNCDLSPVVIPPIRTIRARRSNRVAVLVRKQRKKSRTSNANQNLDDEYYLCLLGRNRVIIDSSNAYKTSNGTYLCTPQHRVGMHCTCRSLFHNIKGSGSASSDKSGRSPTGKASYNNSSSGGGNNSIVCKHLLAVILMPHLLPWRTQGVVEDVVDDKVFTKLVMRASIG